MWRIHFRVYKERGKGAVLHCIRTPAYPEYIYHDMQLRAACLALAAVLFLILVLIFSKSRISYIRYLSGVVDEISKGNLHTRIDKKGYDELTTIAESIDDMQHNLDKMMKKKGRMSGKTES